MKLYPFSMSYRELSLQNISYLYTPLFDGKQIFLPKQWQKTLTTQLSTTRGEIQIIIKFKMYVMVIIVVSLQGIIWHSLSSSQYCFRLKCLKITFEEKTFLKSSSHYRFFRVLIRVFFLIFYLKQHVMLTSSL